MEVEGVGQECPTYILQRWETEAPSELHSSNVSFLASRVRQLPGFETDVLMVRKTPRLTPAARL